MENGECVWIRCLGVPIGPIRFAGSWGYLAESSREATPYVVVDFMHSRKKEAIMKKYNIFCQVKCLLESYLGIAHQEPQ